MKRSTSSTIEVENLKVIKSIDLFNWTSAEVLSKFPLFDNHSKELKIVVNFKTSNQLKVLKRYNLL